MKPAIRNIVDSTPESRQSKNMFRAGRDAEIINRTNYGSSSYNITYSNLVIPANPNGSFYRGGTVMLDGRVFLDCNLFQPISAVYDPVYDTITNCINENVNNQNYPASGSLLLKDGRVFIPPYYTRDGINAQARIYDPITNIVTSLPRLYNSGDYGNALALFDGSVYLSPYSSSTALVLNVDTNEIKTPTMSFPGGSNASGILLDGRVCTPKYGENLMSIWDYLSNTFQTVNLPVGSGNVGAMCLMSDGRLFITNGYASGQAFNIIFDPTTNTSFKTSAPPNINDYFATCSLMANGKVAMSSTYNTVIYDPATDLYVALPVFQAGVQYFCNTVLPDGRLMTIPVYSSNPSNTTKIAFIGEKLPKRLPSARTCSPVYNRF